MRGGSLQVRVREGGQDRWRHSTGAATREEERDPLLDYNKEYTHYPKVPYTICFYSDFYKILKNLYFSRDTQLVIFIKFHT